MFLQQGCKSVTMDNIASENGISKRTLYELFSDKSTLLEECVLHTCEKMKCKSEDFLKEEGNVLEILFKIHNLQNSLIINPKIRFFAELKKFYPDIYFRTVAKFTDFHKEGMVNFLQRGQKEGMILNDIDKAIVSRTIIEISNLISDKDLFSLENVSRRQLFKETMLYFFRGISTEEGIKIIDKYLNE